MRNVDFTAHSCAIATVTTTTPATTTTVAAMRASVRPCATANCNTDAYDGRNIHYPRLWQERTRHDVLPEQQQGNCDEEDEVLAESESESKEPQTSQGKVLYAKTSATHRCGVRRTF